MADADVLVRVPPNGLRIYREERAATRDSDVKHLGSTLRDNSSAVEATAR